VAVGVAGVFLSWGFFPFSVEAGVDGAVLLPVAALEVAGAEAAGFVSSVLAFLLGEVVSVFYEPGG
jgi:hypothetical protein